MYTNEPRRYGNLVSQRRLTSGVWTPHWYQFDAIGSTRELTTSGQVVSDTRLYDAWGLTIASTGTTPIIYLFTGESHYYAGHDTGLMYIRTRELTPHSGRWTSKDPYELSDGPNTYLFARNRPTLLTDPSGMLSWKSVGAPQPKTGPCGQFEWTIQWIPGPNETNGIIIQEVTFDPLPTPCDPNATPKCKLCERQQCFNKQYCEKYYEVWRVTNNTIYGGLGSLNSDPAQDAKELPTDTLGFFGCENPTKGPMKVTVNAFYIPLDKIPKPKWWTQPIDTDTLRLNLLRRLFYCPIQKGEKIESEYAPQFACQLCGVCATALRVINGKRIDVNELFGQWRGVAGASVDRSVSRDWNCCGRGARANCCNGGDAGTADRQPPNDPDRNTTAT
jgi:RHS repeat-associated protein